jgi:hypothetical protein
MRITIPKNLLISGTHPIYQMRESISGGHAKDEESHLGRIVECVGLVRIHALTHL